MWLIIRKLNEFVNLKSMACFDAKKGTENMVIAIETVVLTGVFTLMVYIMSRNPIATLYNYPPKIQERVKTLDEYKDKIPTPKNKLFAKLTASILIVISISIILRYINGYTTFIQAFGCSFLIWNYHKYV